MRNTQQAFQSSYHPLESKSLFPRRLPPVAGLDYYGECHPASQASRDFFDFAAPSENTLTLSIGDVFGQSACANFITAGLQASARALASKACPGIPAIVEELNRILWDLCADNLQITFFLAQIDSEHRELRYVNAGHEPALLVRDKARRIVPLVPTGAILGMLPDSLYEQRTYAFDPGDFLVALTDGVADATDSDDCAIHERVLLTALRRNPKASASDLVGRILEAIETLPNDIVLPDDRTVIVARMLVPEVTDAREDHGEAQLVGCGDDLIVTH